MLKAVKLMKDGNVVAKNGLQIAEVTGKSF